MNVIIAFLGLGLTLGGTPASAQPHEACDRGDALYAEAMKAKYQDKDDARAVALLAQSFDICDRRIPYHYLAMVTSCAQLGRHDEAFSYLEMMLSVGWVDADELKDPACRQLRDDPRWEPFAERAHRARDHFLASLDPAAAGLQHNPALARVSAMAEDPSVSPEAFAAALSTWSEYPTPARTGMTLRYVHHTPSGVDAPYFVHIPTSYDPSRPTPLIVYQAGGWFGRETFHTAESQEHVYENPVLAPAAVRGFIVLFPSGCQSVQTQQLDGIASVRSQIAHLKRLLNVDDGRVYAMGFSDGATGTLRMACLDPSPYASFYPVNPWMLKNSPYANLRNRSVLSLSSEKDSMFDIGWVRAFARHAQTLGADWLYREVPDQDHYYVPFLDGYLPTIFAHMQASSRRVCRPAMHWECDPGSPFVECDWLRIEGIAPERAARPEHAPIEFEAPSDPGPVKIVARANSAVIDALFTANTFTLTTSRVSRITVRLLPEMVEFSRPVRIIVNGAELFNALVPLDKGLMRDEFLATADRAAVYAARVTVDVPE